MNKLESSNELCNIGQGLWEDFRDGDFDDDKYKNYVDHIKLCKECKKGLEIEDVIDEKDLEVIDFIGDT